MIFTTVDRYAAAERKAQAGDLGLWNQLAVNGAVARDYGLLGAGGNFGRC